MLTSTKSSKIFALKFKLELDYSWGEIEHDRRYKTAEELRKDSDIPRRFELISGTLEILDYEFERLSKETELYADKHFINVMYPNDK